MQDHAMMEVAQPRLHIEQVGEGCPVVLLHGWGMHAGIFDSLVQQISGYHTVAAVDLPGHGESGSYDQFEDISQLGNYLVSELTPLLREGAVLVGWSLGGLLAQYIAARYPAYVKKLILFSSTPCFVQREDWPSAIELNVLSAFADELIHNFQGSLLRFLALQFKGSENPRENLRHARELIFARPQPDAQTLQQGLQLLANTDLRKLLNQISCPTLIINGERDTLVPTTSAPYLGEHLQNARCVIFKGAGHAPFLSHPALTTHFVEGFLHEH